MTRRALLHCTLCRSNRNLDTTLLHCRAAICAECQLRSDVANYPLKSARHSRPSIRYIMVVSVKCQKLSFTWTNLYRNLFFHSTNIHRLKLSCNNVIKTSITVFITRICSLLWGNLVNFHRLNENNIVVSTGYVVNYWRIICYVYNILSTYLIFYH